MFITVMESTMLILQIKKHFIHSLFFLKFLGRNKGILNCIQCYINLVTLSVESPTFLNKLY